MDRLRCLQVFSDDGRADLVGGALDLSIRIAATLPDASCVAQPLMKAPQLQVAAPACLRAHGAPKTTAATCRCACATGRNS